MGPYQYRIKAEFRALFANLGAGEQYSVPDMFAEPDMPMRKDMTSPENIRRAETMERLVKAGFVDKIDLDLNLVHKP